MTATTQSPHIVFTGGGTAGHVTPNLALIEALKPEGWKIDYIGSRASIEEAMISGIQIPFYGITSGKLRRYFSWQNFLDPFKILGAIVQSYRLLGKLKTNIVFSKGGFVSFPVVIAAWLRKIPVVAHESDMSPGLANRLSMPFINMICLNFEASKTYFKNTRGFQVTGTPIRSELFQGNKEAGMERCGFQSNKPCLLLMGGSTGSHRLNGVLREALPRLNQHYQVIHLCGKGNVDKNYRDNSEYVQFEYANEELADLLAASDLIISRAGANSLYELLALKKPHVLIPLSAKASRGDQIENACFFEAQGISTVINEEQLNSDTLCEAVEKVSVNQEALIAKMTKLSFGSATAKIVEILNGVYERQWYSVKESS